MFFFFMVNHKELKSIIPVTSRLAYGMESHIHCCANLHLSIFFALGFHYRVPGNERILWRYSLYGIVNDKRTSISNDEFGITNMKCGDGQDRKSTRLNSSHVSISYAVFCLKKKTKNKKTI